MAKTEYIDVSSYEEWVQPIDWTVSLLTGVTVSSVACTHYKPDGSTASDVTATVVTPISYIKIPSGLAIGVHTIHCVATTTDAALSPEVRLIVSVDY